VSTIGSRTHGHHSKQSSVSMARDENGETGKKRKANKDNGTKEKQQQVVYN